MTAVTVAPTNAECTASLNKVGMGHASPSRCSSGQSRHPACSSRPCKGQRRGRYNRRARSFQQQAQVWGDCADTSAKAASAEAQTPVAHPVVQPPSPKAHSEDQHAESSAASCPAELLHADTAEAAAETEEYASVDDKLIRGLSKVLMQWASQTDSTEEHTCFHSQKPPPMSMIDYVARLRTYFFCSDTCFLVALIYIDRLIKTHPHIKVCNLSVHRLFFIASVLAAKYNEDTYYSNDYYARVGGLRLQEVNKLEKYVLQLLDWKLLVQPEEHHIYCKLVTGAVDKQQ
mmetsp:Transcript_27439/g.49984  ORF Transcript_27439/g.49984 Transcript_27439/m.49984 type:complete len:288 (-) Transcript_27439:123-986(-)